MEEKSSKEESQHRGKQRRLRSVSLNNLTIAREHLAASGDVLGCHDGWEGPLLLESNGQGTGMLPAMHHMQENSLAKNYPTRVAVGLRLNQLGLNEM